MNALVAFISDFHGNLPALQTIIADIEQQGIQERVRLGDIMGYGAQSSELGMEDERRLNHWH